MGENGAGASEMRAVVLPRFGGPEVLEMRTVPVPRPGAGEVRVKVVSTSVNPIDYKIRSGQLSFMVGQDRLPLILGRDVAGLIAEVGPDVHGWAVGDAVYARPDLDRGAYAEHVVVREGEMAAAPAGAPLADAGALPLAALTAWQGLVDAGGLQSGQRVLIHGGAGGLGHLAVQFARTLGATVFATCSKRDLVFVRGLGAERAIDYRAERFEEVASDMDVVLDLVGGETQARSWAVLKPGGVLVSPVQKPDEESARRAGVRSAGQLIVRASASDLARVARLIDSGEVKLTVSGRFALADVAAAQARLEQGGVRGKLVVTVA